MWVTPQGDATGPILTTGVAPLAPGSLGPQFGDRPSSSSHERRRGSGPAGDLERAGGAGASGFSQLHRKALRNKLAALVELTKPNITKMVLLTAGVGFLLGAFRADASGLAIAVSGFGCALGTALSSSGASALNQWWEGQRDLLMPRTAKRPIPSGRLHPGTALLSGLALSAVGVITLLVLCGLAAALVSLATILLYVLVYTPMKVRSPLATLVGAVPGALPPLIGWSAGAVLAGHSGLSPLAQAGGWTLFGLMFIWQIPHFLAIAWMYKDDYAKGGHAVLPVFDPMGRATAWTVVIGAATMVPVALLPMVVMNDRLGCISGTIAGAVSLIYVWACVPMLRDTTRQTARRAFFGSIIHLPVVLAAMVGEAGLRMVLG